MPTRSGRLADAWIAVAAALTIVALTIPLFLNPWWVAFEQGRAQAGAWTGFAESDLRQATDSILGDLIVGPPAFDVEVGGVPVLDERERAHMRDVRGVFLGFFAVAIAAASSAAVVSVRRYRADRRPDWRAIRAGALGLIAVLVVVGVVALVAFDALFETFHRIFFPGGSYDFDPSTERLVQLFPFQFWQETAVAVGAVAIVAAAAVAVVAHRRGATVGSPAVTAGAAPVGTRT